MRISCSLSCLVFIGYLKFSWFIGCIRGWALKEELSQVTVNSLMGGVLFVCLFYLFSSVVCFLICLYEIKVFALVQGWTNFVIMFRSPDNAIKLRKHIQFMPMMTWQRKNCRNIWRTAKKLRRSAKETSKNCYRTSKNCNKASKNCQIKTKNEKQK